MTVLRNISANLSALLSCEILKKLYLYWVHINLKNKKICLVKILVFFFHLIPDKTINVLNLIFLST
jgi:hypothetical protein